MKKKNLILHISVIHKGYLDFFKKNLNKISNIYIIDEKLQKELLEIKPDIASLDVDTVRDLLDKIGFKNILVLSKNNFKKLGDREIILIQDEISRNLAQKYLRGKKIEWQSVFLRWDKELVLTQKPLKDIISSKNSFDIKTMKEAYRESERSSDWWRQIGAVLVKNKKIILWGNNKDLPSDHTPYQVGEVRDFFKAGERHDLASTIHAEENIVAQAAKKGISLKGTSLYVTTFPCPVCAKLIALSGIKNIYFAEGGSNFDARKVLEAVGIKITRVLYNQKK
ncbi:MAG: hypothetical protein A3A94_02120 [Candidatus Portnoybacteria bacterium RIFCSPLOWO2_01_FULL_43_11]|uniref:CMP/dCMP-type deaminase domain-containing protein n=4 Tax=Candidatus Portnoyibacteriota TaxID=1817913 RepID=A0A1G2FBY4_9BACT|nr:MAG: hypothetical protein A2815_01925 [Candidatus Portnoybacteria bacterium RIFCSPHIGHO2_01_FULL_40_12b]OGZ37165.1 MAG: hypothetical protein A3D38_01340 [Candidatus Portnoybacteria bacterium RIFCSPHIGHO2_02_FULL_40_23]OGZ37687.1 MAG: hypothetical protein A3E90_00145 [Candidatus Portnoybacteria bacterium RIFCSPHIGHO2_12_FULL_40_11]OGZ38811.1 MAG: hypothetical protein A3A94_02120 [Candidatus Portnoybacteria bacterium RIFCSPLOWO2_01_FULL_43_11]OGZ40399.1 MAG: hypothetical protein A3I20_01825 [C